MTNPVWDDFESPEKLSSLSEKAPSRSGSALEAGGVSLARKNGAAEEESTPAVVVSIPRKVYNAVDDFLYLSGNNRMESYFSLSEDEKESYLRIVSRLAQRGVISGDKLSLDGTDIKGLIEKELESRPYLKSLFYDRQCNVVGA